MSTNDDDPSHANYRRAMIESGMLPVEAAIANACGQSWTTEELRADFEVLSFLAPFVFVRRKSDGMEGTMRFSVNPRTYFDWSPDR